MAGGQHGVAGLEQLAELGLSARAVQLRAAAGRLHRLHSGVYAVVPPVLLSRDGRWMAAVLAAGNGALLSHHSAGALQEIRPSARARPEVSVPGRAMRRRPGIDIHRSRTLTDGDATTVRGIPCTSPARTLLDLAGVLDRRSLERALDQAEILELFDLPALRDQIERNRTRAGARKLSDVLAEHYAAGTVTRSELEERFLALVRGASLPLPEVNAWITLPDGEQAIQADFVWREHRLVIETDGWRTHRTRQAFESNRLGDQRLFAAGWRVARITWRQLTGEPDRIAALIAALLSADL